MNGEIERLQIEFDHRHLRQMGEGFALFGYCPHKTILCSRSADIQDMFSVRIVIIVWYFVLLNLA